MRKYFVLAFLFFLSLLGQAQTTLKLPQPSPRANLTYTVGITEVTINYGAPGVKNRPIWGKLVPYNQVWRAGANEASTISFSTEVRFGQEKVPAGTYSMFVIPVDSTNWAFVLNKQQGLWGTEGYDQKQDLLRLPFRPQNAPFHETLQYSVKDITPSAARLTLNWADKQLVVPFSVETHAKTLNAIKDSIARANPKDWSVYAQAVNYLLQQNTDHDLALQWVNTSINIDENFFNTWLKAKLMAQKNEYSEAFELSKKAQKLGKKAENYQTYAEEIEDAGVLWKEKRFTNK